MKRLFGRLGGGTPAPSSPSLAPPVPAAPPPAPPGSPSEPSSPSTPAADARRIDLRELRSIVLDADELRKGTEVFDRGGLARLARHGERVFCEATGSGASPYRVTITIPAGERPTARCTCFAARTRPFCKHAAALLVAWSRAPESFVVADAPPVAESGAGGATRRASVRTGRAATADLQAAGVAQALALVRELAAAGVATAAVDRPDQIRALAESLRANRLRRMGARVLELADLLDVAARRRGSLDALAYATVVSDLLLTARRIERHLGGEALEDRHVEELIGRNWRKTDRRPVDDLDLTQVAYLVRTTPDDFVIRERRLIDLGTGTQYSEKQILPVFMARRTTPPASEMGVRLGGPGGVYPGFAPHRLDTEGMAARGPLSGADLDRLAAAALPGPAAGLAAFGEHRRDVFAPRTLPVALRADAVVALGDRLAVVGPDGDALLLAEGEALVEAIEGACLAIVIGDVDLDGILAILRPLAVVTGGAGPASLRALDPAPPVMVEGNAAHDWLTTARAAGASPAALSLAEVRDELAVVLVNGLGSLTDRVADPLATRLTDLGLERPAALLREVTARPDPADRLDDLVRLLQVLAIGAVRLAGTRSVDRAMLVPVPGHPALLVPEPGPPLPEEEVARRRWSGTMGWAEAAVHRARRLAMLPASALEPVVPWWADASAATAVVDAAARAAPGDLGLRRRVEDASSLRFGLAAALTAVAIAARVEDRWGAELLGHLQNVPDPPKPRWVEGRLPAPQRAIRIAARRAIASRGAVPRPPGTSDASTVDALIEQLRSAMGRDRRVDAARELATIEDRPVLAALRRAFRSDPAPAVRIEAAWALATLGDLTMIDAFVDALALRVRAPEAAKGAAYALGLLGDVRGVAALVDALADGWKSSVVLEALGRCGELLIPVLVDRALAEPALATRRGFVSALESQPPMAVLEALVTRLAASPTPTPKQQIALLRLAAAFKPVHAEVARRILSVDAGSTDTAARRAAEAVLKPPPPKAKAKT